MKLTMTCMVTALTLFVCVPNTNQINAATPEANGKNYADDRILTVLPFDAIPAILNPEFVSASEAKLRDDSPVIGVSINGESRAYSIYLLNGHEIVNDAVGGEKIAATW